MASYKYCKVIQAKPDLDGLVCKVVVSYFNVPSMKAKRREVNIWWLTLLPTVENLNRHWFYKH